MLRNLKEALDDFRAALRTNRLSSERPPGDQPATEPATVASPMPPAPPAAQLLDEAQETGTTIGQMAKEAADGTATAPHRLAKVYDVTVTAPTPIEPEQQAIPAAAPPRQVWWKRRSVTLSATALIVIGAVILRWSFARQVEPADPEVVATYRNGSVTREQLKQQFAGIQPEEQPFYQTADGLKALVVETAVDDVTRSWAAEKQVDQQEVFKDAMKHATENILIADVSDQLHKGQIQVGEGEIQAYYDQNREQFGERALTEVKDQIRQTVVEQKEQEFITSYLKELRERASLQVDYSLLEVPDPAEQELTAYYQTKRADFSVPEQAQVAQIQVNIGAAGGDEQARARAETARARAAAGEDFATLVQELSDGIEKAQGGVLPEPVARGSRGAAFDEAVFPLKEGEFSPVFKEGESYVVVKLLKLAQGRQRSYEEVRDEILNILRTEREQQVFAERKDRTLFTIHSRRTTLGEFLKELEELPPEERALTSGLEGKRKLLDSLIDRLLVVEDASEQASEVKGQDEIQQARTTLLSRLLHQEDVDEKIAVTDDEVRAAYDADPARFADPPRVKVRYIRVSRGLTPDEDTAARAKIEEAAAKLKPSGLLGRGAPAADFATVAKEYSEDADTAATGGELDRWFGESGDQMSEIFEHALHQELLALNVDQISSVLPLGDSYYLFQIREKQEARTRPFEEVQALVRQDLEARKHDELSRQLEQAFMDRMQLQIYDTRILGVLDELGGPRPEGTRQPLSEVQEPNQQ